MRIGDRDDGGVGRRDQLVGADIPRGLAVEIAVYGAEHTVEVQRNGRHVGSRIDAGRSVRETVVGVDRVRVGRRGDDQ